MNANAPPHTRKRPMFSTRPPTDGLVEMDSRFRAWLGDGAAGRVDMRWEIDGRLWMRLEIRPDAKGGLRYIWIDSERRNAHRRRIASLDELETLAKRQLLEPAGEDILVYWNGADKPRARMRAMIAQNDQLRCVWNEPAPPPRPRGLF